MLFHMLLLSYSLLALVSLPLYEFFILVDLVCFFFFFSSRRRHTRSLYDWSSDVCSSDLARAAHSSQRPPRAAARTSERAPTGRSAGERGPRQARERSLHGGARGAACSLKRPKPPSGARAPPATARRAIAHPPSRARRRAWRLRCS